MPQSGQNVSIQPEHFPQSSHILSAQSAQTMPQSSQTSVQSPHRPQFSQYIPSAHSRQISQEAQNSSEHAEQTSPHSGQRSAQFSHPSPQGQTVPQSEQSPQFTQKLSAPAQSTHLPHSTQSSPSEQLEHFSQHSMQTTAQFAHPPPHEQTISTQVMQSAHSEQKLDSPTQDIQKPQSTQISPSEHSEQCSPQSGQTTAQVEHPPPQ